MAKAEITQIVNVPMDQFFEVITDYDSYPKFVEGCKKVEVKRKKGSKTAEVKYHVSLMKDLWYLLEQTEDKKNGKMSWKLIESDTLKGNVGSWTLVPTEDGKKTEVTYEIDIEFGVPVPGFILSKLIKTSLPSMIRGFEKFALSQTPSKK